MPPSLSPYDSPINNQAMNDLLMTNAVLAGDPTLLSQVTQLLEPVGSSTVNFAEFKDGVLTAPSNEPIQALAITSSTDTQVPIVLNSSVAWFASNANNIKYYSFGGPVNPLTGKQTPVQMTYALGDPVILSGSGDDFFNLNGSLANATIYGGGGADTIITGSGDDYLSGDSGNDSLISGAGNDTLNGGVGNDTMRGGLGDDIYYVDSSRDSAVESSGQGLDKVISSLANYTLVSNVEQLELSGVANINGTGNNLVNTITGNIGNNVLNGGTGADTLIGLAGNDTYVVDNVVDVVTEALNEGTDLVQTSVSYTLGANLENLTLTGNANINGTGNALNNVINGNNGINTLLGLAGNDTIIGGNGNDFINGGAGADSLNGGGGNDRFVYTVVEDSAPGTADRITGFVRGADLIDLTGMGFTWIGTNQFSAANQLRYSTANGVTTIEGNTVGANGAEFSIQLTGDIALTASDFVGVTAAANTMNGTGRADTINGTAAANIINGLNGDDRLNGLAGNDSLNGGAGNDSLSGGAGADVLSGGTGNDIFLFAAGDSTTALRDTITDFRPSSLPTSEFDLINASAIDANVLTRGNDSFTWVGARAITAAGQLHAVQQGADVLVQGNTDGNLATFEFEVLLVGVLVNQLNGSDFIL